MKLEPLSQHDLIKYTNILNIPHFRGVFMRDQLPRYVNKIESGILNLDSIKGPGTHWTCWIKNGRKCYYFDSYGITSPTEFDDYIRCDVIYSTYNVQKEHKVICGHLCLHVLYETMVRKRKFHEVILELFTLIK